MKEGLVVQEHNFKIREVDTQSMSFAKAQDNPPLPLYALETPWNQALDVDTGGRQRKTEANTIVFHVGCVGSRRA